MKERTMNCPRCGKEIPEYQKVCPYCGEKPTSASEEGTHPDDRPAEPASHPCSDRKKNTSSKSLTLKQFLCRYWLWIAIAFALPIGRTIYSTHKTTKPMDRDFPSAKYDTLAADSLGAKLNGTNDYHHEQSNGETSDE